MQAPQFWQNPPDRPGIAARLLAPLAALWRWMGRRRLRKGPWNKVPVPVICVGNINMGGTGKTPTVIALAARLGDRGLKVHVVSRGHGGSLTGPVRVDPAHHDASQVGDEPLLIAAFCDTWVARDRHAGAAAAVEAGADVILLDDGFQNPTLFKDISITVVDAVAGFGNGRVFPAGPLRELPGEGLARTDLLLVIGGRRSRRRFIESLQGGSHPPIVEAVLKPLETGMSWKGQKVLAFAGIGRPEKFFATLRGLGAEVVHAQALSDHQPLTTALMKRLETEALLRRAQLVTTEKDAVRLPADFRLAVATLPVRLEVQDWAPIDAAIEQLGI